MLGIFSMPDGSIDIPGLGPVDKSREVQKTISETISIQYAPFKYFKHGYRGCATINDHEYVFEAKVLDTESEDGIDKGRVTKLYCFDLEKEYHLPDSENYYLSYNHKIWRKKAENDEVNTVLSLILNEFQ